MNYYARRRVPVEQFFRRMKMLMAMSREIYILDQQHRQTDTENMIMLANCHIIQSSLNANEGETYAKWITYAVNKEEKLRVARVAATSTWRKNLKPK